MSWCYLFFLSLLEFFYVYCDRDFVTSTVTHCMRLSVRLLDLASVFLLIFVYYWCLKALICEVLHDSLPHDMSKFLKWRTFLGSEAFSEDMKYSADLDVGNYNYYKVCCM